MFSIYLKVLVEVRANGENSFLIRMSTKVFGTAVDCTGNFIIVNRHVISSVQKNSVE